MNKLMITVIMFATLCVAQTSKFATDPVGQMKKDPSLSTLTNIAGLQASAEKGLDVFKSIAGDAKNAPMFNLAKAADAKNAVLNQPMREFFIRLDSLKTYQYGQNPDKLLVDVAHVHFPVSVNNNICGEITMNLQDMKWNLVSVNDVKAASYRLEAKKKSIQNLNTLDEGYFIVKIPAMNVEFIAYRSSNAQLQLTSVYSNSDLRLEAGVTYPAAKVLAWLASGAIGMEDIPH